MRIFSKKFVIVPFVNEKLSFMMTADDLKHKLDKLKDDHRLLDEEIESLMEKPLYDQLAVQRLKKRKLQLKDEILRVKKQLFPDIIA